MPAASTLQAEAERRSKISAALKGVPKGPRRPWNAEARARRAQSRREYWAALEPEQKDKLCSKISASRMAATLDRESGKKICRKCGMPLGLVENNQALLTAAEHYLVRRTGGAL